MPGRILVLDDEQNYAAMLQDLLRQHSYQVDMSTKPELAITQLEEVPYDLVISDYKMPVMDGADFLKRSRELYPNLPVILVSGLMNTPELVKVANMGVTLVFEKPLDNAKFLSSVAQFAVPMTNDEKSHYRPSDNGEDPVGTADWPEAPKFFSALSPCSEKTLKGLWSCCNAGRPAFVHAPEGSDVMAALKDVSSWKGHKDLPIKVFTAQEFFEKGEDLSKTVLEEVTNSQVVAVELNELGEVAQSRRHFERIVEALPENHGLFFVFILKHASATEGAFMEAAGIQGVTLAPLKARPLDLAHYVSRFIRKGESQLVEPRKIKRSPEAIYTILSYDWPENYKEVQEVIPALVSAAAVDLDAKSVNNAVGLDEKLLPHPGERLSALMRKYQAYCIRLKASQSGDTIEQMMDQLQLTDGLSQSADLASLPLVVGSTASN
jgi:CheY-like chemotaxis protein